MFISWAGDSYFILISITGQTIRIIQYENDNERNESYLRNETKDKSKQDRKNAVKN